MSKENKPLTGVKIKILNTEEHAKMIEQLAESQWQASSQYRIAELEKENERLNNLVDFWQGLYKESAQMMFGEKFDEYWENLNNRFADIKSEEGNK